MRADGPAERPGERGMRCRDPASERALRGLGLVDDRHQLEIGLTERHNPVGRAPAGVTAALDRSEAVPHFDLLRGRGKVGHRDQYVVELQSYEASRPAVTGQAGTRHLTPNAVGNCPQARSVPTAAAPQGILLTNAAPTCTTHCSRSAAASPAFVDSGAQSEMTS